MPCRLCKDDKTILRVEALAPPTVAPTPIGKIVEAEILSISIRYPAVTIDHHVIMPNHVHLIVSIHEGSGGASPSPTLFDVIRVLKSMTTRKSRGYLGKTLLWQRSYHEHVIRNEDDYRQIWEYIENNPARWAEDRYYAERRPGTATSGAVVTDPSSA